MSEQTVAEPKKKEGGLGSVYLNFTSVKDVTFEKLLTGVENIARVSITEVQKRLWGFIKENKLRV